MEEERTGEEGGGTAIDAARAAEAAR